MNMQELIWVKSCKFSSNIHFENNIEKSTSKLIIKKGVQPVQRAAYTAFIVDLMKFFTYELPIDLDLSYDDRFYITEEGTSNKKYKIGQHKKDFTFTKTDYNEEELNEWFTDEDTQRDTYIKKKFYETLKEVIFLYPNIKDNAYSLCFKTLMKHVLKVIDLNADSIDSNVFVSIAQFRMSSFKQASELSIQKKKEKEKK